jgi:deoxyadenosine/deoxycytidine kinase
VTPPYVLVAGNIGVGKTTTVDVLSELLAVPAYHEPFDENRYFSRAQQDPSAWAFHAQLEFFYGAVLHSLEITARADAGAVQDRGPHEILAIFGDLHRGSGHLHPDEFALLERSLARLESFWRTPDVLLHLHCPLLILEQRIAARGRPEESKLGRDSLAALADRYNRFIAGWTASPVATVDVAAVDARTREGQETLLEALAPHIELPLLQPTTGIRGAAA